MLLENYLRKFSDTGLGVRGFSAVIYVEKKSSNFNLIRNKLNYAATRVRLSYTVPTQADPGHVETSRHIPTERTLREGSLEFGPGGRKYCALFFVSTIPPLYTY